MKFHQFLLAFITLIVKTAYFSFGQSISIDYSDVRPVKNGDSILVDLIIQRPSGFFLPNAQVITRINNGGSGPGAFLPLSDTSFADTTGAFNRNLIITYKPSILQVGIDTLKVNQFSNITTTDLFPGFVALSNYIVNPDFNSELSVDAFMAQAQYGAISDTFYTLGINAFADLQQALSVMPDRTSVRCFRGSSNYNKSYQVVSDSIAILGNPHYGSSVTGALPNSPIFDNSTGSNQPCFLIPNIPGFNFYLEGLEIRNYTSVIDVTNQVGVDMENIFIENNTVRNVTNGFKMTNVGRLRIARNIIEASEKGVEVYKGNKPYTWASLLVDSVWAGHGNLFDFFPPNDSDFISINQNYLETDATNSVQHTYAIELKYYNRYSIFGSITNNRIKIKGNSPAFRVAGMGIFYSQDSCKVLNNVILSEGNSTGIIAYSNPDSAPLILTNNLITKQGNPYQGSLLPGMNAGIFVTGQSPNLSSSAPSKLLVQKLTISSNSASSFQTGIYLQADLNSPQATVNAIISSYNNPLDTGSIKIANCKTAIQIDAASLVLSGSKNEIFINDTGLVNRGGIVICDSLHLYNTEVGAKIEPLITSSSIAYPEFSLLNSNLTVHQQSIISQDAKHLSIENNQFQPIQSNLPQIEITRTVNLPTIIDLNYRISENRLRGNTKKGISINNQVQGLNDFFEVEGNQIDSVIGLQGDTTFGIFVSGMVEGRIGGVNPNVINLSSTLNLRSPTGVWVHNPSWKSTLDSNQIHITGNGSGIWVTNAPSILPPNPPFTIQNQEITQALPTGIATGILITNLGLDLVPSMDDAPCYVTIQNSQIATNQTQPLLSTGIHIQQVGNQLPVEVQIRGTTIHKNKTAIQIEGGLLIMTDNDFIENDTTLLAYNFSSITANYNHFQSLSSQKVIVNLSSTPVNASMNYWGTNIYSQILAKIQGAVDFCPWMNLDSSMLHVAQLPSGVQYWGTLQTNFSEISEAIEYAPFNGTIVLHGSTNDFRQQQITVLMASKKVKINYTELSDSLVLQSLTLNAPNSEIEWIGNVPICLSEQLNLIEGVLKVGTQDWKQLANATLTYFGSPTAWIEFNGSGKLWQLVPGTGNQVIFPVGSANATPAAISTTGLSDWFGISVKPYILDSRMNPFSSNVVNRTWEIVKTRIIFPLQTNLSLYWQPINELPNFNRAEAK
ncbi:MAG: hypothetical protein NZ108_03090, partial [Bacteroidia bacterium]|nr:hypothetical protein [Bacteroidia bacterium]